MRPYLGYNIGCTPKEATIHRVLGRDRRDGLELDEYRSAELQRDSGCCIGRLRRVSLSWLPRTLIFPQLAERMFGLTSTKSVRLRDRCQDLVWWSKPHLRQRTQRPPGDFGSKLRVSLLYGGKRIVDCRAKSGLRMEEVRKGCWPNYEAARTGKSAMVLDEACSVCC